MTSQPPQNPYDRAPALAPGPGALNLYPTDAVPGPATGGYAGQPAFATGSPWGPLAGWGTRVAAMLIDSAVQLLGMIPYVVGIVLFVVGAPDSSYDDYSTFANAPAADPGNTGLMIIGGLLCLLGLVLMVAIQIWNRAFKQGRTGQSIGKKVMGIRLVEEYTGRPIGAGMAFVRDLAHTLDGFLYLGYLWPLWDDKRQTFADKILNTVVVEVPKGTAPHA
jgi:uncharacterized RDD family membrane protein YckC